MSIESFSSESSNPRIRRSLTHAKISKAIATGKPEDKLAAVEVAITASKTRKGQNLGREAVSAMLNSRATRFLTPRKVEDAHPGGYTAWTSTEFVHLHEVVVEALGVEGGTVFTKPKSTAEYQNAAIIVHARSRNPQIVPVDQLSSVGESQQLYLKEVDWSVPGTLRVHDAVMAIAVPTNSRTSK